jgi:hypothetical protein
MRPSSPISSQWSGRKRTRLRRGRAPAGVGGEVQQVGAQGEGAHGGGKGHVAVPSRERAARGSCDGRATSRTCSRSQRIGGAWCVRSCQSW